MKRTRTHLRLESRLYKRAKKLAQTKGVTLTALIEEGLRSIVEQEEKALMAILDAEQI